MNLPNKLTLLRITLIPIFILTLLNIIFPYHYLVALAIFGFACYTDHLDGSIARKKNLITNFGKFFDPIADKILVLSALICFVHLHLVNVWFVIALVTREFMVTSIRLIAVENKVVISANNLGKAKTISQMLAILLILGLQYLQEVFQIFHILFPPMAWFPFIRNFFLLIATILTWISGFAYLKNNWHLIRSAK